MTKSSSTRAAHQLPAEEHATHHPTARELPDVTVAMTKPKTETLIEAGWVESSPGQWTNSITFSYLDDYQLVEVSAGVTRGTDEAAEIEARRVK